MKGTNHTAQLSKGPAKWKEDLRGEKFNIAIPTISHWSISNYQK